MAQEHRPTFYNLGHYKIHQMQVETVASSWGCMSKDGSTASSRGQQLRSSIGVRKYSHAYLNYHPIYKMNSPLASSINTSDIFTHPALLAGVKTHQWNEDTPPPK